ncbi:MAG: hypothetical protein Q9220_003411 [cf. Caloplaca sp. 1 TL-2023]
MTSTPSASQKSSRWGAFLAGVESRLDTILADEDQPASKPKPDSAQQGQDGRKDALALPTTNKANGENLSRPPSTSRAQDRLNERLAKAMANRNLQRMNDKSPATSVPPSRTASPANGIASPRPSTEMKREEAKPQGEKELVPGEPSPAKEAPDNTQEPEEKQQAEESHVLAPGVQDESNRPSFESRRSDSIAPILEIPQISAEASIPLTVNGNDTTTVEDAASQYKLKFEQMRLDYEAAELRRQEETHSYLERIDALQSKLQYLSTEAAQIARTAKLEAPLGSPEEKLAAKEEKIALLMEEGHKLSQTELKHMSIIRRLRAKATDDEKYSAELRKTSDRNEQAAREAQERAKRAEEAEKRVVGQVRSLPKLVEDLETMKQDRDSQDALIQDLQAQLSEATSAARREEEKQHADALLAEKTRTAALGDELSNSKIERELAERQYQTELREMREKSDREKERARVAEIERQGEQNILESRLEAYRARAEEASAGAGGDVQAKLLRQIETLQNQYAVASENWQGIEGSLLARAAALENERDDTVKKEADVRRKARETYPYTLQNVKFRRAEEELERVASRVQDLDHQTSQQRAQISGLREKLAKAEADASTAKRDLLTEREAWETKQAQRAEEERLRQHEYSSRTTPDTPYQHMRTESPVTSGRNRKPSNAADKASPQNNRRLHGLAITGTPAERPVSRRSSTHPFNGSTEYHHHRSLSRQDSMSFAAQTPVIGGIPETPSIQVDNQDDFFDGVRTPATPERTINDMISVSTAGAGPSVQLVERMSAAVRRLESEKAAHKDELARLSAEREESREQVVGLMKEAEEKRAADARAKKLELEAEELNARYQTTLEMLGEKSEKVDELKADVADLKEMYRELVDRTMK